MDEGQKKNGLKSLRRGEGEKRVRGGKIMRDIQTNRRTEIERNREGDRDLKMVPS